MKEYTVFQIKKYLFYRIELSLAPLVSYFLDLAGMDEINSERKE